MPSTSGRRCANTGATLTPCAVNPLASPRAPAPNCPRVRGGELRPPPARPSTLSPPMERKRPLASALGENLPLPKREARLGRTCLRGGHWWGCSRLSLRALFTAWPQHACTWSDFTLSSSVFTRRARCYEAAEHTEIDAAESIEGDEVSNAQRRGLWTKRKVSRAYALAQDGTRQHVAPQGQGC